MHTSPGSAEARIPRLDARDPDEGQRLDADPHRLRLDRRGWLLLDELAVELASAGTG